MEIKKYNYILVFFIISVILFFVSMNLGMFWDNVVFASKMGNYLYENGLFYWKLPDNIDPGHPPFLAFVQAAGWKIFGHKLWVSHLMMWPFVFGFLVQLFKFISCFFQKASYRILAFILVIADPTLSSELLLISPEVIQLFFFFLAVNSIYQKKIYLKTIALSFLGITFFRGMMLCAGVFIFELVQNIWVEKKKFTQFLTKQNILSYIIGSLPALAYVIWRLFTKGWLQSHPDSPWAECWHFATLNDFIRNIILIAHRYGDFGRIFILLFVILSLFKYNQKVFSDRKIPELINLSITPVIIVIITCLLSTNAFGHRYFIVSYIAISLISFHLIINYTKRKKIIYGLLLLALITGNLWIYPEKIAQGWSASLAHLPYHLLRREAIEYIDKEDMKIEDFASFFPNYTKIDDIDLNGDMRIFNKFDGKNQYVFYSNVYNLSDDEYDLIENNYHEIQKFNRNRIKIIIFEKNNL